jgi:hypothetical protein
VGGWKAAVGDGGCSWWGEDEEVVFRGEVKRLSKGELEGQVKITEGDL